MLGMTPQAQEKSGREVWAKRTGSQHGSQLASLRDTLLTLADIKPDDLVLDLHARSGLLSNEASRLTKEGGVWTLAFDDREYETLVKNAPIDALVRPQIILTTPEKFDKDLRAAAGEGVGFSVIVGRNILTHCDDKSALIEKAAGLLEKKGRIVLAEVVPKHGQRLSELLHFKQNDTAIETLFQSVEEELFRDSSDPMLNWDEESLKRDLEKIGLTVRILIAKNSPMTRVLPSNVDFWFRRSLDKNRKSLGDRLAAKFNEEDLERLKSLFHEQLDNKEVQWKTSMAYFKITRE
jgi:precorrin-6B methylase 2